MRAGGLRSSPKSLHHGGKEDTEAILSVLHDAITERVLSAAMKVHTALGAGCLESTYDACLRYQLTKDGIAFEHQLRLPVVYDGVQVDAGYRIARFNKELRVLRSSVVES